MLFFAKTILFAKICQDLMSSKYFHKNVLFLWILVTIFVFFVKPEGKSEGKPTFAYFHAKNFLFRPSLADLRYCRTLLLQICRSPYPEAQFIVPDWGDKVDYGIELSYRPLRLHWLAGRYGNPMPYSTVSPSKGLWIWLLLCWCG